jgi:hypothetical protein
MPKQDDEAAAAAAKAAQDAAAKEAADKAAKDAADKAAADALAAEEEKKRNAPPEKYTLALGKDSALAEADVEKTAAIARELGLSQAAAAKVFDLIQSTTGEKVMAKAQEFQAGGEAWTKQVQTWEAAALADAELGGGNPDTLKANVTIAQDVAKHFFDESAMTFFNDTGLGSHPGLLKGLLKMSKAFKEGTFVRSGEATPPNSSKRSLEDKFYGKKAEPSNQE